MAASSRNLWYWAWLVQMTIPKRGRADAAGAQIWRNLVLVQARSADEALAKAEAIGRSAAGDADGGRARPRSRGGAAGSDDDHPITSHSRAIPPTGCNRPLPQDWGRPGGTSCRSGAGPVKSRGEDLAGSAGQAIPPLAAGPLSANVSGHRVVLEPGRRSKIAPPPRGSGRACLENRGLKPAAAVLMLRQERRPTRRRPWRQVFERPEGRGSCFWAAHPTFQTGSSRLSLNLWQKGEGFWPAPDSPTAVDTVSSGEDR